MIVAVDIVPVLLVAGLTAFVVSTAAMAAEALAARRSARSELATQESARAALARGDEQDLSPSAAALLGKARSNAATAVRAAAVEHDVARQGPAAVSGEVRHTSPGDQPLSDVLSSARQQAVFDSLSPAEAAQFATFVADSDPDRVAGVLREWLSSDGTAGSFTSPVVRDDLDKKRI